MKKKGFSIAEVILASFILTTGLISIAALVAASYRQSIETRDAIIASSLAQEGAELIRNVRDNNIASDPSRPFNHFPSSDRYCRKDYADSSGSDISCVSSNPSGNPSRYRLSYAGGFYSHTAAGSASKFHRYIYIDNRTSSNSVLVRSFVFWGPVIRDNDTASCTASNKCAYTEVTLTNWK